MSYTILTHVATGDLATAALQNAAIDNFAVLKTPIDGSGNIAAFGAASFFSSVSVFGTSYLTDAAPMIKAIQYRQQTVAIASGVLAIDIINGNHVFVTMNANITSITLAASLFGLISNYIAPVYIYAAGDGTARTVTWTINGSAVRWPGGVAPTLTSTNGKFDLLQIYNVNNVVIFGRTLAQNL